MQEFKVGQKVKVHSGWNINLPEDLKEGDCTIEGVNPNTRHQPNIYVRYENGVGVYVYPNPDENRVFDVEILEDVAL